MDADELLLRGRVHQAYDARAFRGPSPAWVGERVRARVAETARRQRRTAGTVAVGAGLLLVSVVGIRLDLPKATSAPIAESSGGGQSAARMSDSGALAPGEAVTQNGPARIPTQPAPQHGALIAASPCPKHALKIVVTPDQQTYGQGDVATITTTVVNSGDTPCRFPQGPAVWITGSDGRRWRLCPEPDAPPSPPDSPAMEPADHAPAPQPAASSFFWPGATATADCTWHTAYGNVPPGTYIAHATWNSSSAAVALTVEPGAGGSEPSPSPGAPPSTAGSLTTPPLAVHVAVALLAS